MGSPTPATTPRMAVAVGGRSPLVRSEERFPFVLLGSATAVICLLLALAAVVPNEPSPAALGEVAILAASLAAAAALWSLASVDGAWRGAKLSAWAAAAGTGLQLLLWLNRFRNGWPKDGGIAAGSMVFVLAVFLASLFVDFAEHTVLDRADLLWDVAVVGVLAGGAAFLLLRQQGHAAPGAQTVTVIVATLAVAIFAGWCVLGLWVPSPVHFALFASSALAGGAAVLIEHGWRSGASPESLMGPEIGAALSLLAFAGILVIEPRLVPDQPAQPRTIWWIRPALLALSLCAAFAIVVGDLLDKRFSMSVPESLVLAFAVFATIGVRSLINQVAMGKATGELGAALRQSESALDSLRSVAEAVSGSEARHRLLLSAAVDGIVELDREGTIVRVNNAFCSMVRLTSEAVVGRSWAELTGAAGDAAGTLAALPETGQAAMVTESGTVYLEARSSTIPTSPPSTLLLIRDVTPAKVAEQTIRTLFQFLQNRDEDRTRLLKRMNAAIEVERNRIARDLHDGPVQGISAAALSVEAVRLMVENGDVTRASNTLKTLAHELSQEAIGLRRVMSDLRPPVLEQRGLIPAVRDLCARLQRDLRIPAEVSGVSNSEVSSDVETLAYRVIQEALSNVGKHSHATHMWLRIETSSGMLRVEVKDDGDGFDTELVRDFLHAGKVGLASMRERAELAGGTFTIQSSPGAGTTVIATLPFEVLGDVSAGDSDVDAAGA